MIIYNVICKHWQFNFFLSNLSYFLTFSYCTGCIRLNNVEWKWWVDILVPHLNRKVFSLFNHAVWCYLFFVDILYQVEEVPLYSLFAESLYQKSTFDFVKRFFSIYGDYLFCCWYYELHWFIFKLSNKLG